MKRATAKGTSGCAVPWHDELAPGTLRGILRLAGVSVEEFVEQL